MALGALAACVTTAIAFNAPRHGIKLEGIEIKISCNLDPSVLFEVKGPESHTTCISNITSEVKIKGNDRRAAQDGRKEAVHWRADLHAGGG